MASGTSRESRPICRHHPQFRLDCSAPIALSRQQHQHTALGSASKRRHADDAAADHNDAGLRGSAESPMNGSSGRPMSRFLDGSEQDARGIMTEAAGPCDTVRRDGDGRRRQDLRRRQIGMTEQLLDRPRDRRLTRGGWRRSAAAHAASPSAAGRGHRAAAQSTTARCVPWSGPPLTPRNNGPSAGSGDRAPHSARLIVTPGRAAGPRGCARPCR